MWAEWYAKGLISAKNPMYPMREHFRTLFVSLLLIATKNGVEGCMQHGFNVQSNHHSCVNELNFTEYGKIIESEMKREGTKITIKPRRNKMYRMVY